MLGEPDGSLALGRVSSAAVSILIPAAVAMICATGPDGSATAQAGACQPSESDPHKTRPDS